MVVVQDAVGASVAGTSSGEGGALDDLFAEYGSDSDTERMELDGAREQWTDRKFLCSELPPSTGVSARTARNPTQKIMVIMSRKATF